MTMIPFDPTISVAVLLNAGTIVFAWLRTRRRDVDERLDAGATQINRLDARVSKIEDRLEAAPARGELHRLELLLVEMGGDMKAMGATMKGMSESLARTEDIVSRHEDHLRERQ